MDLTEQGAVVRQHDHRLQGTHRKACPKIVQHVEETMQRRQGGKAGEEPHSSSLPLPNDNNMYCVDIHGICLATEATKSAFNHKPKHRRAAHLRIISTRRVPNACTSLAPAVRTPVSLATTLKAEAEAEADPPPLPVPETKPHALPPQLVLPPKLPVDLCCGGAGQDAVEGDEVGATMSLTPPTNRWLLEGSM